MMRSKWVTSSQSPWTGATPHNEVRPVQGRPGPREMWIERLSTVTLPSTLSSCICMHLSCRQTCCENCLSFMRTNSARILLLPWCLTPWPNPDHYDDKTGRESELGIYKNRTACAKAVSQLVNQLGHGSTRSSAMTNNQTPQVVVDAFDFRAALFVTAVPVSTCCPKLTHDGKFDWAHMWTDFHFSGYFAW